MKLPYLVVCDNDGNIFEVPELQMAGASASTFILPDEESLIPAPQESVMFILPGRTPIGFDPRVQQFVTLEEYHGKQVSAVAAFMPPGYIRTLHTPYQERPGAPRLPLYCYSAVGWKNNRFYSAGIRIDRQSRHDISDTPAKTIAAKARATLKQYPKNRLIAHLVNNCVLKYNCANACNLVLGRQECPIAVSSACNAACLGCISEQPRCSGFPSSQHRIDFTPTAAEIIEYVVNHLKIASDPIASFGQGCEGEPLLQAKLIEESIVGIRAQTSRGMININTNGSLPKQVERLCVAGLNSMRVSINSAQAEFYNRYYQPKKYRFEDVVESISIAKKHGIWVSINYLVFPGFTDHPAETSALKKLLKTTKIDMIQTRNLNIDPLWFIDKIGMNDLNGKATGMRAWIEDLRTNFPNVKLGYFNPTFATIKSQAIP